MDLFEQACTEFADKISFTCMGQDVTFRDIDEMSAKFATFLCSDGSLEQGNRVAIQLPNLIQYPLAEHRVGFVLQLGYFCASEIKRFQCLIGEITQIKSNNPFCAV